MDVQCLLAELVTAFSGSLIERLHRYNSTGTCFLNECVLRHMQALGALLHVLCCCRR